MPEFIDQISFRYWKENRVKSGTKSFQCVHNGYVYGKGNSSYSHAFIFRANGTEKVCIGPEDEPKAQNKVAYQRFLEEACSLSDVTFQNFQKDKAEKFRIYSSSEVEKFSSEQLRSTRLQEIKIRNVTYYAATNLNVCEYIHAAVKNTEPRLLDNWSIGLYWNGLPHKAMEDSAETEVFDPEEFKRKNCPFTLEICDTPTTGKTKKERKYQSTSVKIDFQSLNRKKERIGFLGEQIVLDYEKKRLTGFGREDLAERVEHSSVVKGDGLGYDIASYTEDGTPLFIEVKSTTRDEVDGFYLSRNERTIADYMLNEGKNYQIYRVYSIKVDLCKGKLAKYMPPFDEDRYEMQPENWFVKVR